MARVTKEPLVRMNEILDAAEQLFFTKGYDETAVSDIVKQIGAAQGTFYNYFSSKEAVLEAIVNRQLAKSYYTIADIVTADLIPPQKIEMAVAAILTSLRTEDGYMFEYLYQRKNLHIVDRLIRQASTMFGPMLRQIMEEGNRLGFFQVVHFDAVLDFTAALFSSLFHALYQRQTREQLLPRLEVAGRMLAGALGVGKDGLRLQAIIDELAGKEFTIIR